MTCSVVEDCTSGNWFRLTLELLEYALLSKPLMATLKPQSNGSLYSNSVIGTLAVDGWAVTFGTARSAWAGWGPFLAVPNVSVSTS